MKIAMIGSGAAGSVFAAYLRRGGADMYLVDKYKAHMLSLIHICVMAVAEKHIHYSRAVAVRIKAGAVWKLKAVDGRFLSRGQIQYGYAAVLHPDGVAGLARGHTIAAALPRVVYGHVLHHRSELAAAGLDVYKRQS